MFIIKMAGYSSVNKLVLVTFNLDCNIIFTVAHQRSMIYVNLWKYICIIFVLYLWKYIYKNKLIKHNLHFNVYNKNGGRGYPGGGDVRGEITGGIARGGGGGISWGKCPDTKWRTSRSLSLVQQVVMVAMMMLLEGESGTWSSSYWYSRRQVFSFTM